MNEEAQFVQNYKGRGALNNPTGRFESIEVVPDPEFYEAESSPRKTEFFNDNTQSIISYNDSPDVGFRASVNPYRGCEHGCIYCYARPTHEYLGMSCGLDFESKILVKKDAPKLLRKALSAKSWQVQPLIFSGVTDCYQPAERRFQLTRQCLEILAEFKNPTGIITKNFLVTRDTDVLSEMAENQIIRVYISITTLDEDLANKMEPRTARPAQRLKAIQLLREAGIPVGVMMGPIIPGLTDWEIDAILKRAAEAGAQSASYTMLRLPYGVKDLFQTWLKKHYPLKAGKVLHRIMDVRNGKLNDNQFSERMRGKGVYADYIANMFALSRKRHGLEQFIPDLRMDLFRIPGEKQLSLFQ